ncbi:hypothetical protein MRX96_048434 [Rhipicephalus microplus]
MNLPALSLVSPSAPGNDSTNITWALIPVATGAIGNSTNYSERSPLACTRTPVSTLRSFTSLHEGGCFHRCAPRNDSTNITKALIAGTTGAIASSASYSENSTSKDENQEGADSTFYEEA